jgi:tetratricopeptide (TPR) repeat protein
MRLLAKSHQALNNYSESVKWARLACTEDPNIRESWVDLASIYYHQRQWHNCFSAAKTALDIKDKVLVYTMDPTVWGAVPHDLLAISAYNLGLYSIALEHGKIAADIEPKDDRLANNLKFYQDKA